tara:strand:+ start:1247 stop:1456 length:210 start_codon:yes stop_codon:yes gene_type:complete
MDKVTDEEVLIGITDVLKLMSISKNTLLKLIKEDETFPRSIQLVEGKGFTGTKRWVKSELKAWLESKRT